MTFFLDLVRHDIADICHLLSLIIIGEFMSFFNHVQLHEYDITDKGITQACYDELVASGNNSTEDQLWVLAYDMCQKFKDYMRPLFS